MFSLLHLSLNERHNKVISLTLMQPEPANYAMPFERLVIPTEGKPFYKSVASIRAFWEDFYDAYAEYFGGIIYFAVDKIASTLSEAEARYITPHQVWKSLQYLKLDINRRHMMKMSSHLDLWDKKGENESITLQSGAFFHVAVAGIDRYKRNPNKEGSKPIKKAQRLLDPTYVEAAPPDDIADDKILKWLSEQRLVKYWDEWMDGADLPVMIDLNGENKEQELERAMEEEEAKALLDLEREELEAKVRHSTTRLY